MNNFNIAVFQKTLFSPKTKAPAGKCTQGKIFLRIFLDKTGPCGKMQTRQKNILRYFFFFPFFFFLVSGRGIFIYHKFSHLTTIYFIRKNSYFSYTIFLLEHNRIFSVHNKKISEHNKNFLEHNKIFSEHNRIFSEHNRLFSHHNRVFSHHNGVFSEHNRILSNHNRLFPEHTEVFREQKYQENGRILHNLALV